MAKFTPSPLFSDIRNKIGGVVATKVRSGNMVRRKVSPIQPRSSAQRGVRSSFSYLSKLWSGSSMASNRAAWNSLAATIQKTDAIGNKFKLTGHQMFVQFNRNLRAIGLTEVLTVPASLAVLDTGAITLAKAGGPPITVLSVALTNAVTSAETAIIQATAPQSPGIASGGQRYRQIASEDSAGTWPYDFLAEYVAKFGTPTTGKVVYVRVKAVTEATGASSGWQSSSITI